MLDLDLVVVVVEQQRKSWRAMLRCDFKTVGRPEALQVGLGRWFGVARESVRGGRHENRRSCLQHVFVWVSAVPLARVVLSLALLVGFDMRRQTSFTAYCISGLSG